MSNDHKQTAITKIGRTENTSQSHSLWFFSFTHPPTHQSMPELPIRDIAQQHALTLSHKQDTIPVNTEPKSQFSAPSKYSYSTVRTKPVPPSCSSCTGTCWRCHLVSFFYDYRSSIMLIKSLVHYFFPAVLFGTQFEMSIQVRGISPKQVIWTLLLMPTSQYQTSTSW
jgi:hypothetical protein